MDRDQAVAAMLEARSIAVVGASARPDSFGQRLLLELAQGGFEGEVYPVNPRYREISGASCYPALDALPVPVDLAILGVPNARLEEQLTLAGSLAIPAAVIFASCYEEPSPGRPSLPERLQVIAEGAGMAVCGGNCMGFLNLDRGLRACGYPMPEQMEPGPIAFISHSGSAFAAFAYNDRRLRFNVLVSSGQEMVTTTADYLHYVLDRASTRVVGLFLETIRDPARFRAALAKAEERDVPVVALKVGRTAGARAMVTAHSGALAGEDAAYEALFDAYGVARVATLDEMADALELFASGRRAAAGGLASIHDSGGERAHFIDIAAEAGVAFADIGAETKSRLEGVLEEGLPAVNPLDAWGTGNDYEPIYIECIDALVADPGTAALAFSVDLTTEMYPEGGYVRVAKEMYRATSKPVAVLSNLSSAIDRRDVESLRAAGVPVLEGTDGGLAAFAHLLAYRDRARPPEAISVEVDGERAARWSDRLSTGDAFAEAESLRVLADYGVPVVRSTEVSSLDDALAAAQEVGYPVALKTAAEGMAHKSDVAGVFLALQGPNEVRAAYGDLTRRIGPHVTVAAMAPDGLELALGLVRDPQFGPMVMVGAGGRLVEVLADRIWSLPPMDDAIARRALGRLGVASLFRGVRGAPPVDLEAVARAVAALSVLAIELGEHLDALDVNPLIASARGCMAVDALVVPRR